jgi:hypothetical protein
MTYSCGCDEILVTFSKNSVHYIISQLTYVINSLLGTGIFPDCLKCSEIRPINKEGDKNFLSNYRPISLLTSL